MLSVSEPASRPSELRRSSLEGGSACNDAHGGVVKL